VRHYLPEGAASGDSVNFYFPDPEVIEVEQEQLTTSGMDIVQATAPPPFS
jgi:hypothetical protein